VPFIRRDHFEEAMSRARRSVSDKDIRQYESFMSKQKSEAAAAGAGGFSFDDKGDEGGDSSGSGDKGAGDDESLYG
jgi:transitional endoplasmic reticulum ATPase